MNSSLQDDDILDSQIDDYDFGDIDQETEEALLNDDEEEFVYGEEEQSNGEFRHNQHKDDDDILTTDLQDDDLLDLGTENDSILDIDENVESQSVKSQNQSLKTDNKSHDDFDDEDDDDDGDTRERFKSERRHIPTIESKKTVRNIPDSLDQVALNDESKAQLERENSNQRFGSRNKYNKGKFTQGQKFNQNNRNKAFQKNNQHNDWRFQQNKPDQQRYQKSYQQPMERNYNPEYEQERQHQENYSQSYDDFQERIPQGTSRKILINPNFKGPEMAKNMDNEFRKQQLARESRMKEQLYSRLQYSEPVHEYPASSHVNPPSQAEYMNQAPQRYANEPPAIRPLIPESHHPRRPPPLRQEQYHHSSPQIMPPRHQHPPPPHMPLRQQHIPEHHPPPLMPPRHQRPLEHHPPPQMPPRHQHPPAPYQNNWQHHEPAPLSQPAHIPPAPVSHAPTPAYPALTRAPPPRHPPPRYEEPQHYNNQWMEGPASNIWPSPPPPRYNEAPRPRAFPVQHNRFPNPKSPRPNMPPPPLMQGHRPMQRPMNPPSNVRQPFNQRRDYQQHPVNNFHENNEFNILSDQQTNSMYQNNQFNKFKQKSANKFQERSPKAKGVLTKLANPSAPVVKQGNFLKKPAPQTQPRNIPKNNARTSAIKEVPITYDAELEKPKAKPPQVDEEDELTKELRLKIEQQKKIRENFLKKKEERRKQQAAQRLATLKARAGGNPNDAEATKSNLIGTVKPKPLKPLEVEINNLKDRIGKRKLEQMGNGPAITASVRPPVQQPPVVTSTGNMMKPAVQMPQPAVSVVPTPSPAVTTSPVPAKKPALAPVRKVNNFGKIRIGNLASTTSLHAITKLCTTVGPILKIVPNQQNRSALVLFKTLSNAKEFQQKFDRYMLDLSVLKVELISNVAPAPT